MGIVIGDTAGGRLLDVLVPGGAYDPGTRVGWSVKGHTWRYVDRSATPRAGVTAVAIKDLSRKVPGLVQFRVLGAHGAFPVDPTKLPLTGLLAVDPPTAETGQCGASTFAAPTGCLDLGHAVNCR